MWHGYGKPIFANCFLKDKSVEEKVIELNNIIDYLIDVADKEYFNSSDVIEQARLDGKIKAYWEVKNLVENILVVE